MAPDSSPEPTHTDHRDTAKAKFRMPKRRKLILWLGLCASVPGAAYASLAFVYFVWLEGIQESAGGKAGVFALGALAFGVLCAGVFIHCLVSLIKNARHAGRNGQGAT